MLRSGGLPAGADVARQAASGWADGVNLWPEVLLSFREIWLGRRVLAASGAMLIWSGLLQACIGRLLPSQKQLKWSQLKVGLTVIVASITLARLSS